MVKRFFILLLPACMIFSVNHAQQRIGNFMAWGRDYGLPSSLYGAVFQSSDGYLWLGGSSGLVRFDGKRFKTFISRNDNPDSPSDNVISDFTEDNNQNLWICGSIQGVTRYNLKTGTFKKFPKLSADKTPGYGIHRVLKDSDGELWFATDGRGLAKYVPDRDTFMLFIPDSSKPYDGSVRSANHFTGIAEDKGNKNILWLSSFSGLYSFNKISGRFTRYVYHDREDMLFMCVVAGNDGQIWLGTWFEGLISFDSKNKKFSGYAYSAVQKNGFEYAVNDICQVSDSLLYLASFNEGLLSFNTQTKQIVPLLTTGQLPQGSSGIDIQRISKTRDAGVFAGGNYYVYQEHKAFNRLGNYIALDTRYKTKGSPPLDLSGVVWDRFRNGYWMSGYDSRVLHFFDRELKKQVLIGEGSDCAGYRDVAIDRFNNVWASCISEGLVRLDESTNKMLPVKLASIQDMESQQIRQIETDSYGNLWMATKNSLIHFDVTSGMALRFSFSDISRSFYPPLLYLQLHVDEKNNAWVNTDKGLFFCELATKKLQQILPGSSGLANAAIKSMTIDSTGHPWLGFHYNGLQLMDPATRKVVREYDMNDGMPGMQVNTMATDGRGRIWAGFAAGLAMFDPHVNSWQLFNRDDGIVRDYVDGAIFGTEDGRMFLVQPGGFIHFKGEEFKATSEAPVLHITSIRANGKEILQKLSLHQNKTVDLPSNTTEISIEFAAMDWLYPLRTKYYYLVENIHEPDAWVLNEEASVHLAGLGPGNYRVRIYAVNGDGIKTTEKIFSIVIHPPFWMRWWFISLCVLAFTGMVYALYRYRIRQIKKLQQMRNNISRNLHDDIGASLSNINILNELAKRNAGDREKASGYLVKSGEDIQRISESLSDIVWNVNPRYDNLENLFVRMKRYAADMFDGRNIEASLSFPEIFSHKFKLPMDQRRDFYLVFKEAVNNLVKYSEATRASVLVNITDNELVLIIEDNGNGFDMAKMSPGNGLHNMAQRAAKWQASLVIDSVPGKGTAVKLTMPLNQKVRVK